MVGDHIAPEVGQLPKAWTRGGWIVAKKQAAQKVRCRIVQNEMRDILSRMTIGPARSFSILERE